jgi:sulfatase modifying factor 1
MKELVRTILTAGVCLGFSGCPFLSDDWKIVSDAGVGSTTGSGANTSGVAAEGSSGGLSGQSGTGVSAGVSMGSSGAGGIVATAGSAAGASGGTGAGSSGAISGALGGAGGSGMANSGGAHGSGSSGVAGSGVRVASGASSGAVATSGASCTPTATQCSGVVPQTCAANGTWQSGPVTAGKCGAVCTAQTMLCAGGGIETCNANGQWGASVACPATTPFCTRGGCTVAMPSCAGSGAGLSDCGLSKESCCTSLPVAGGTYFRTYPDPFNNLTASADPATVSTFRLDKYDVTVGRFRPFVTALNAGWVPDPGSGKHTHLNGGQGLLNSGPGGGYEPGWNVSDNSNLDIQTTSTLTSCGAYGSWTPAPGANENRPINCVNWWVSYAFCIWDGGAFLPSEAEWEYAAAGGSQQREYPWGSTAPGTSSQYAIYACLYPSGASTCVDVSNIAPVGTAASGGGLFGQLDLVGNVWQWTLDWHDAFASPCIDCAALTQDSYRVYRGDNAWDSSNTADFLFPAERNYGMPYGPTTNSTDIGVRCARTP